MHVKGKPIEKLSFLGDHRRARKFAGMNLHERQLCVQVENWFCLCGCCGDVEMVVEGVGKDSGNNFSEPTTVQI